MTRNPRASGAVMVCTTMMLAAMTRPAAAASTSDTVVGPTDGAQAISLVLVPRLRDAAGASSFAYAVSQPGDPLYQHFVTPSQFADRFALSASDYDALVAWASAQGFTVGEKSVGRTALAISGPASRVAAAFGVRLQDFRKADGTVFHAADHDAVMPSAIAGLVDGVIGLSDRVRTAPMARVARRQGDGSTDTAGGSGVLGAFSPQDLRKAYFISPPPTPVQTETVALFEQGGYTDYGLKGWLAHYHLPPVAVRPRVVAGVTTVTSCAVDVEALLDMDMVITANPGVKQILVYEDNNDPYPVALLNALTEMANDNKAQTVNISYGIDEVTAGRAQITAEATLFAQLAAQGVAVFVSSGDGGAYGRTGLASGTLNVSDPASQPFVTSVGGTSLHTGAHQFYLDEEVWNDLPYLGASGGGISSYWKLPSYQLANGSTTQSVAAANGGSNTRRNVPDISSIGDPQTGVSVLVPPCGGWLQVGGTSVSAPLVAGLHSALDNAYLGLGLGRIGFFNPLLYSVGQQNPPISFDILAGTNAFGQAPGYNAGRYFDDTTGWGSPWGWRFLYTPIQDRTGAGAPAAVTVVHAKAGPYSLALRWKGVPGATGYLVYGQNYTVDGGFAPVVATTATSTTLKGLAPNSTYVIYVTAVNQAGSSSGLQFFEFHTKRE